MNFIEFIEKKCSKKERRKGAYGQVLANGYSLKNLEFIETVDIIESTDLELYFDDANQISIEFKLIYSNYYLAEICFEAQVPFVFEFFFGGKKIDDKNDIDAILLDDQYKIEYEVEIENNNLSIKSKDPKWEICLKLSFNKIDIDIDFINKTSFINSIQGRNKCPDLFDSICERISDEQLTEIASADYVYDENCFAALKSIRDSKNAANGTKMFFQLAEVLFLMGFSSPNKKKKHEERVFTCMILLLFKEGFDYQFDDVEEFSSAIFLSVYELEPDLIEQARHFFISQLESADNTWLVMHDAYLILACDLLLKDQNALEETFAFLQEINVLQETSFEFDTSSTAKRFSRVSSLMIENIHSVEDTLLRESVNELVLSMLQVSKERYDIETINAMFEKTFSKTQQQDYLSFLHDIENLPYLERYSYLIEKGLSIKQAELLKRSQFNAELFIEGFDYEMDLKHNVFFDYWVEVLRSREGQ